MTRKTIWIAAVAMLTGGAVSGTADARGISALTGRAVVGSDLGCFGVNTANGRVTNGCGGSEDFVIGLDTDSNSAKTINIAVISFNTSATWCQSVAIPRSGSGASVSAPLHPSISGSPVNIQLTGSTTTSQGLLYVHCVVGSGDSLIQVDYNS